MDGLQEMEGHDMTNKEIEIIAKNSELINKFKELGELREKRLDSSADNEFYKRKLKELSFEIKSKVR